MATRSVVSTTLELQLGDRVRRRTAPPAFTPEWVRKEKQILRFTGYMQQYLSLEKEVTRDGSVAVPPQRCVSLALTGQDEYCVRRVLLRYFMLDNTIQLLEPRVPNSGLQQGVLLSRQPVPHASHPHRCYHFTDLTLGSVLHLYGRSVTLADCDLYTRDVLESEGVDVGDLIAVPADPYLTQRAADLQSPLRESRLMEELGAVSHGARPGTAIPTEPLLRFAGMVEESSGGGAVPCVVLYDPRTCLLEVRRATKEPGSCAVVLKWCSPTLPSSSPSEDAVAPGPGQVGGGRPITTDDLAPPATLMVFGRRLLISDCDQHTRAYLTRRALAGEAASANAKVPGSETEQHLETFLQETAERTLERPAPADLAPPSSAPPRTGADAATVAGTGGARQQVGGSAGRHHTDITGRRLVRPGLLPHDARAVLRFSAKLQSQLPIDQDRQFVLSFYPSDKTMELTEIRRGGGLGGKVVSRTRVARVTASRDQGGYCELSDLSIGSAVTIYGRRYVITGCDKRVLTVVQEAPEAVSSAFRESVRAHFAHALANTDENSDSAAKDE